MRPDEAAGVARLVGLALKGTTTLVYDVHTTVSDRVFDTMAFVGGSTVSPVVSPVRLVHDMSLTGLYSTVRGGLGAGSRLAELVAVARVQAKTEVAEAQADLEVQAPDQHSSLTDHPRTHLALSMLNAFHGDLLDDLDSPLTLTMALRHDRRDVVVTSATLAATYPQATPTLVVFLHGLAENDDSWGYRAHERFGDESSTYGRLLERDLGVTALYVRYNTGLRVSANGASLAALLDTIVSAWPVPVEQVVLIGHSMGGLVIHSSLAVDGPWTDLVSHTITLGTPHLGAPLEQAVTRLAHAAPRSVTMQVVRRILRGRSLGIKDLRHGNLVHADWHGHDPDDPSNRRVDVQPHPAPRHHAVVCTVTKDPGHLAGAFLGDLMVLPHSAGGLEIPDDQVQRFGGLHHLDLLNHPLVYDRILAWLRGPAGDDLAPVVGPTSGGKGGR